jgi:hypothetical protein
MPSYSNSQHINTYIELFIETFIVGRRNQLNFQGSNFFHDFRYRIYSDLVKSTPPIYFVAYIRVSWHIVTEWRLFLPYGVRLTNSI